MTNQKRNIRRAKALLRMFEKSRKPLSPVSPYVRMAKALVGR